MNNFERNCIFGLFRIMVRLLLIAAACVVAVHAKEQKGNIFGVCPSTLHIQSILLIRNNSSHAYNYEKTQIF